jgi:DNA-binding response OmpR family regulator
MSRILVVEDEPTIAMGLHDDLALEGFTVDVVSDGETGARVAQREPFDLIVLDVMLPGKDGFTVCRELRSAGLQVPIILLTARGQEADKIAGLRIGADDYVTKPFSPGELVARVHALLRRAAAPVPGRHSRFGEIQVDFARHEVMRRGKRIDVTPSELKLLRVLTAHEGEVLSIDRLLDEAWGADVFLTDRVIYTHINNLRAKIETDPRHPRHIRSVRGVGYRFER